MDHAPLLLKNKNFIMVEILSINADITGSEFKWVMARLLMSIILYKLFFQASGFHSARQVIVGQMKALIHHKSSSSAGETPRV